VPPPVGVRGLDSRAAHASADLLDRVGAPEVEDEEALRMRLGRAVTAAAGELEMCARAGEPEEDAVVAVVPLEAPELGEPDPVPVEADDLLELLSVPSEPDLELRRKRRPSAAIVGAAGGRSSMVEP
jgi:hypothetical protein